MNKYSPQNQFVYCPKCGQKSLQHNDKCITCKNCDFVYYINMNAAVAAIICNDKQEILFSVRKNDPQKGKLDLPGGFVDLGETAEEAIVREIYEELGVKVVEMSIINTFVNNYLYKNIEYQTLDIIFKVKINSFENIKPADDVADVVFKSLDSVNFDDIAFKSIKNVVLHIKNNPELIN